MTQYCGTVALVGLPNAGKSSLLNQILGQKLAPVTHKPNTTRKRLHGVLTRNNSQFIFVDTPGVENRRALPEADLTLWIVDVKKPIQMPPVKLDACVLVLNQIDRLPHRENLLPLISAWNDLIKPKHIFAVSAKTGEGLELLLKNLERELPERDFVFDSEAITDASERDLVAELIREKALLELEQEVPYQLEVLIESFDESRRENSKKNIVDISAVLQVARESHKSIVIGKKGSKLKQIGQGARLELEKLLGCQVMLRLLVRVR